MRSPLAACVGVGLVCFAARAHAQAPEAEADARKLLQRGTTHYELAEYDLAIDDFKAAYELAPAPGLLFDIAQAYRLKGTASCVDAARFYRNYLRLAPNAPNHALVETRIVEMDRCADTATVQTPVVVAPPPPPQPIEAVPPRDERDARSARWVGVAVAVGGVAAVGAGLGLYLSADADFSGLAKQCAGGICPTSRWQGSQAKETAGVACMLGGGALAVSGVVLWALWPARARKARAWVAPFGSDTAWGVAFGGAL
jgi:tetratricopeptide (TPR) repeat protein